MSSNQTNAKLIKYTVSQIEFNNVDHSAPIIFALEELMQRNLNVLHFHWECEKLNWLVSTKRRFYLAHIIPSLSTAKETSIRDSTEKMKSNQIIDI